MNTEKETQFLNEAEKLELEQVKREREERRQVRRDEFKGLLDRATKIEREIIVALGARPVSIETSSLSAMTLALMVFLHSERIIDKGSVVILKKIQEQLSEIISLINQISRFRYKEKIRPRGVSLRALTERLEKVADHDSIKLMVSDIIHLKKQPVSRFDSTFGYGTVGAIAGIVISLTLDASNLISATLIASGLILGVVTAVRRSLPSMKRSNQPIALVQAIASIPGYKGEDDSDYGDLLDEDVFPFNFGLAFIPGTAESAAYGGALSDGN